jgi:hypothetical protein
MCDGDQRDSKPLILQWQQHNFDFVTPTVSYRTFNCLSITSDKIPRDPLCCMASEPCHTRVGTADPHTTTCTQLLVCSQASQTAHNHLWHARSETLRALHVLPSHQTHVLGSHHLSPSLILPLANSSCWYFLALKKIDNPVHCAACSWLTP